MTKEKLAERIETELRRRLNGAEFDGDEKSVALKMKTGAVLEVKLVMTGGHRINGTLFYRNQHYEAVNRETGAKTYFSMLSSLSRSMAYGHLG